MKYVYGPLVEGINDPSTMSRNDENIPSSYWTDFKNRLPELLEAIPESTFVVWTIFSKVVSTFGTFDDGEKSDRKTRRNKRQERKQMTETAEIMKI